jgi:hypothetical protein
MPYWLVRSVQKMAQEQEDYAEADGELDRQGGNGDSDGDEPVSPCPGGAPPSALGAGPSHGEPPGHYVILKAPLALSHAVAGYRAAPPSP